MWKQLPIITMVVYMHYVYIHIYWSMCTWGMFELKAYSAYLCS